MHLAEYPRPPEDTGLGVHWSAGPVGVVSLADIRRRWLPELRAMHIKWVKCLHDGAEGLVEELRAAGIMPIVRLYRFQPNPGRLDQELRERVKRLLAAGAVYFEVNNEPNLMEEWRPGEWQAAGRRLPEIVAEHWVADAEYVLEQGGLPAFPAPTPGGHWDDVDFMRRALGFLADRGRDDLFHAGAWLAVHNYFLNHPPDYPYDPVNQYGQPVSPEERERRRFLQPIEAVNRLRRRGRAPGRTLREDSNGFLKYRLYRDLFVERFGFEVPVLSTEGGVVMGRAQDPRYPVIDAELHTHFSLFSFAHMADAPDYYFCTCSWLIANRLLNHDNPAWERDAWFSDQWPGGQLPIVQAIKQRAPWPVRLPARRRPGVIELRVEEGAGHTLVVRRSPGDDFVADVNVDARGRAQVLGLMPGTYRVEVVGVPDVTAQAAVGEESITLALSAPPRRSAVEGEVLGLRNAVQVQLFVVEEEGERLERHTILSPEQATFVFDRLWAGRYRVTLAADPPVATAPFRLDGRERRRVRLVVPRFEWRYRVENPSGRRPTEARRSVLVIEVPETLSSSVRVEAPWAVLTARVGNKPEINPRAAVFDALPAGTYRVRVDQVPGEAVLVLDGQATAKVTVERVAVEVEEDPALSRLRGRLDGRDVAGVEVILNRGGAEYARTRTDPQGNFLFEELPAGTYMVFVPALGVKSAPVELHGRAEQILRLPVPNATMFTTTGRAASHEALPAPLGTYLWMNCAANHADTCARVVVPVAVDHAWTVGCTPLGRDFARQTITVTTEANVGSVPAELVAAANDPLELGARLHHVVARVERVRTSPFAAVRGRVEGAPADVRAVQLWAGEVLVAERPLEDRGAFRFERVPPGEYVMRPSGRQEPAWPLVAEANETVDLVFSWPGHRSGSAQRGRVPLKYILLGRREPHRAHVLLGLVLPLLTTSDCVAGFRPEEALGMTAVLLLADEREFASAVMRRLQEAEVPVSWVRPRRWADVEPRVRQFIQEGE